MRPPRMAGTAVEQVVAAIAEAEGIAPEDLDVSLQHYVSTDAIQDLAAHDNDAWRLEFETNRHVVELTRENAIRVDGDHRGTFS